MITLFLIYKLSGAIDPGERVSMEDSVMELEDTKEYITSWEAAYKHPLLVSSTEIAGPRDTRVVSYVFQ